MTTTATKDETLQGRCEAVLTLSPLPLTRCGKPALLRYPAMGGGYMRLCGECGMKHRPICERWNGHAWEPRAFGVDGGAQGDTHA